MKNVKEMLRREWQAMLDRGIIPVFEFGHGGGEFTTVEIQYKHWRGAGIYFDIDSPLENPEFYFSGDVKKRNGSYYLPADKFTNSLHELLEQIHTEIIEGYIIPNDLYVID